VSIVHPNPSSNRYHIQAVIVESSAPVAAALRKSFYALQPDITKQKSPYVGRYTFVPFLPSKEWTIDTIYNLARLHMKLITDLMPVCINNVQDIRNIIHPSGVTLYQGFLSMLTRAEATWSGQGPQQLLESVHNTGKPTIQVALVPCSHEQEAKIQFAALQLILLNNILPEYHDKVFHEDKQPGLSEQTIDSIPASAGATYAQPTRWLRGRRPPTQMDSASISYHVL
jgi:hypothetical protein